MSIYKCQYVIHTDPNGPGLQGEFPPDVGLNDFFKSYIHGFHNNVSCLDKCHYE